MALISAKDKNPIHKVKAEIDAAVAEEIQRYCAWANVDINLFIEGAARFVFEKDKEWKALNRQPGRRGRKPAVNNEPHGA